MAGQRQYYYDFILNAVLNGGFSAVFTKAQQEFIRLGEEIKRLQTIQRDISAYQKQEQAIQHTTKRLENLKAQEILLGKEIEAVKKEQGEDAAATAALEREKLKLAQEIDKVSAALNNQQDKMGKTKERLDAAGVSTDNLAQKDKELTDQLQELTEEQKKAAEGAADFGTQGVGAVESVAGAIAAAGIAQKIGEIKDAYVECVKVAGDFEQAMSAVEAISDATSGEMQDLTAEAKRLGATTIYTAQETAKGMEYMAMAGWNAQEMLGGMSGMTTLAAAAGEDLAQVSDIVTDNLTAFGLAASDTAHFADVLATTASKSNTNIAIMGETFKNSASVAGALKYSVEDVSVAVGLMANSGIKGTRAGTALRNIFNGLLEGATLTSNAFGELEYSSVKSDGTMKSLMETVRELRGYFDQMTEAERVNNAVTIAGMRGYNGLLAILNATDEDFQSLYASVNDCAGAAERMAKIKLDNLNGDITVMNSAMEALKSTIGEQFEPELRGLTQLQTELLNGLNTFIKENPALTKGIMAGTGAFLSLGSAIVGVNAAIQLFKKFHLATLFTGHAGTLLGVAGGIAAVAAAAVGMNEALRDGGAEVREMIPAALELDRNLSEAKTTYEETAESILATANVADTYIDRLEELRNGEMLSQEEQKEYQNTLALLLEIMPDLSNCISTVTDKYGRATYTLNTDTETLRQNTEAWKENAKARAYQTYMDTLMEEYGEVLQEKAKNEIALIEATHKREEAEKKYNDALERQKVLTAEAREEAEKYNKENENTGVYLNQDEILAGNREYQNLNNTIADLSKELTQAQEDEATAEEAIERGKEAVAEAEEAIDGAEQAVKELTAAMGDAADGQNDLTDTQFSAQQALEDTMTSVQELAVAYTEAYNAAYESFSGQFGLFDQAKADSKATVEAAQKAQESQLTYWQNYNKNMETVRKLSADDLHITQENYDALIDYLRTGTPEIAGLLQDMAKDIEKGNTQAITNLANTVGEKKKEIQVAADTVGDWMVGLSEQVDGVVADIQEDVQGLEMGTDAANAAKATIQAYIDQAGEMLPQVENMYGKVRHAAINAMWRNLLGEQLQGRHTQGYAAYATGTDNAPPGWAWVGEAGPELMRMGGGEQILPAHISREVAQLYNAYNSYTKEYGVQTVQSVEAPPTPALEVVEVAQTTGGNHLELHFHIEAGAAPETVDAWRDYVQSGNLKAAVLETLEDAEMDMRRRRMT